MGNTCFLAAFLTWSVRRWVVAAAAGRRDLPLLRPVDCRAGQPGLRALGAAHPVGPGGPDRHGRSSPACSPRPTSRNDGPAPIRLEALGPPAAIGRRHRPVPDRPRRGCRVAAGLPWPSAARSATRSPCSLLGTTGALNLYAPIQPYLGAIGIALLALALVVRLRGEVSCATLDMWRQGIRRGSRRPTGGPADHPRTSSPACRPERRSRRQQPTATATDADHARAYRPRSRKIASAWSTDSRVGVGVPRSG